MWWPVPLALAAEPEVESAPAGDPAPAAGSEGDPARGDVAPGAGGEVSGDEVSGDEVSEEIVVEGAAIRRAREEVVGALAQLGYDWKVVHRGDHTVYRAQANWKGKVVLTDEGVLRMRRTGPRFTEKAAIVPLCVIQPSACVRWGSWTLADRRWIGLEQDVAAATDPGLVRWGDAVADQHLAATMTGLPARLEALWTAGVPLSGDTPLGSAAERRRALLAYWDSRTETEWGFEIRAMVESFVREVVETGPDAFTPEERAAFEATRRSAEPFPFDPPSAGE